MDSSKIKVLEPKISQILQDNRVPGVNLVVIKDLNTIYSNGFGTRDLGKNLPMTADTLNFIA